MAALSAFPDESPAAFQSDRPNMSVTLQSLHGNSYLHYDRMKYSFPTIQVDRFYMNHIHIVQEEHFN